LKRSKYCFKCGHIYYMFTRMMFIVYLNVEFVQSDTCTFCHKWYQFLISNCVLYAYSKFCFLKLQKPCCKKENYYYCKCYLIWRFYFNQKKICFMFLHHTESSFVSLCVIQLAWEGSCSYLCIMYKKFVMSLQHQINFIINVNIKQNGIMLMFSV